MKNLILCCLATLSIISLAACSSDNTQASTTQQSASMQTDTKSMHPVSH